MQHLWCWNSWFSSRGFRVLDPWRSGSRSAPRLWTPAPPVREQFQKGWSQSLHWPSSSLAIGSGNFVLTCKLQQTWLPKTCANCTCQWGETGGRSRHNSGMLRHWALMLAVCLVVYFRIVTWELWQLVTVPHEYIFCWFLCLWPCALWLTSQTWWDSLIWHV